MKKWYFVILLVLVACGSSKEDSSKKKTVTTNAQNSQQKQKLSADQQKLLEARKRLSKKLQEKKQERQDEKTRTAKTQKAWHGLSLIAGPMISGSGEDKDIDASHLSVFSLSLKNGAVDGEEVKGPSKKKVKLVVLDSRIDEYARNDLNMLDAFLSSSSLGIETKTVRVGQIGCDDLKAPESEDALAHLDEDKDEKKLTAAQQALNEKLKRETGKNIIEKNDSIINLLAERDKRSHETIRNAQNQTVSNTVFRAGTLIVCKIPSFTKNPKLIADRLVLRNLNYSLESMRGQTPFFKSYVNDLFLVGRNTIASYGTKNAKGQNGLPPSILFQVKNEFAARHQTGAFSGGELKIIAEGSSFEE